MIGRLHVNKSGGNNSNNLLPIYQQMQEPKEKIGVWIKSSEKIDNIYYGTKNLNDFYYWKKKADRSLTANSSVIAVVGTDIYLFGGIYNLNGSYLNLAYKYDTLTNSYTQISNLPYTLTNGFCIVQDTDIYIYWNNTGSNIVYYTYKYDTLTDTYAFVGNHNTYLNGYKTIVIGDNVYGFSNNVKKYNLIDKNEVIITNSPLGGSPATISAIGTNIYLFGCNSNHNNEAYKFDTLTNEFSELSKIPTNFNTGSSFIDGKYIYLISNNYENYKYNIDTNSYEKLKKINSTNKTSELQVIKLTNGNVYAFENISSYELCFNMKEIAFRLQDTNTKFNCNNIVSPDNMHIYLFGGFYYSNTLSPQLHIYDIVSNTYAVLTTPFSKFLSNAVTSIDDIIYTFGDGSSYTSYKLDTKTNTYTSINSYSLNTQYSSCVAVGTNIYIFVNNSCLKYDTLTDRYTSINCPCQMSKSGAVAIENDIYLIGTNNFYKYDTVNNIYTKISDNIKISNGTASALGNDIYILVGTNIHKYNVLENTYEQVQYIDYSITEMGSLTINNDIYIFGNGSNIKLAITNCDDNSFIYLQIDLNNPIFDKETLYKKIGDIIIRTNKEFHNPKIYLGDGEKWNLLKGDDLE